MEVLFAGVEVVFVFSFSLVKGSCVRKQVDNLAEMACAPKISGVTRTLLEHIPLLPHAANCLLYFTYGLWEEK